MNTTARNVFYKRPLTGILWIVNLAAIPAFSCFGRTVQRYLADTIGRPAIAWILGAIVLLLLLAACSALVRKSGPGGLFHLLWMILLAAALMFYVRQHPERWWHIPLFGGFGFLSVRLFSVRTGTEIAIAFAFLDEVLQHFLAYRTGDIDDMVINALCAGAGIIFCLVIRDRSREVTGPGREPGDPGAGPGAGSSSRTPGKNTR
ncbi:MAG: VanZ family protein [Candidatus Erginobacter occultus]|nr:VanZ family protein [Candidatus Erginobacter occultus]